MALGFFRRRQKLVLIIMVLLMVAFLIPGSIRGLFERKPYKVAIGHAGDDKITQGMLLSADADIRILTRWLALGAGLRPGEMAFVAFQSVNQGRNPALAWALLVHEARTLGVRVTRQEIDAFLAASGRTGESYQRLLADLTREKLGEKDLLRAVTSHLMIAKALEAGLVGVPPSLPELRVFYRDLRERIQLGLAVFEAEDFAGDAAEPSETEIREWFAERKRYLPLHPTNQTEFGFGYRQPNRADVAWLLVDQEQLTRAVDVPERLMREYWLQNKGKLTKEVPVTTTRAAPTTTTAPTDTQPTQPTPPAEPQTRTVVITRYSEAKPIIRDNLSARVAEDTAADLLAEARKLIDAHADSKDPYQHALSLMTSDAEALLGRKVDAPPPGPAPLETVVEQLEGASKVRIAYPYGEREKLTIDPTVEVDLSKLKGGLTLKQLLEEIGSQLKLPRPIAWRTCRGLPDALFAAEPVDLMPVRAGRTGMLDFPELARTAPLDWASTAPGGGLPLVGVVVTAQIFQAPGSPRTPLIEVGGDFGQAMYVYGPVGMGRLLWRLAAAKAEHEPERITPAIRQQIVRDIKLLRGFHKATEAAKKMLAQVRAGEDLEKLAEAQKRTFLETEPFARKEPQPIRTAAGYRMVLMLPNVPEVGRDAKFVEQAFSLVPDDPDDPAPPARADVALLRRARKLLLIQRVGYEPATESHFRDKGLDMAIPLLMRERYQRGVTAWLSLAGVGERVVYTARQE